MLGKVGAAAAGLFGSAVVRCLDGREDGGLRVVQGRRRPCPAGFGAPTATRRRPASFQFSRRCRRGPRLPGSPARLRRTGGMSRRRRARFPPSPAMPDRPCTPSRLPGQGSRWGCGPHPRNRQNRGPGGRLMSSPHPAGRAAVPALHRPRTLRAGFGPAAGVRQGDPAWRTGASPVPRGIRGRPEGGPIPARVPHQAPSAGLTAGRSHTRRHRRSAGPALPAQAGRAGNRRSAAIPLGAGPALVSRPGRYGQAP